MKDDIGNPLAKFEEFLDGHWPGFLGDPHTNIDDLRQLFVVTIGLYGEKGELVEHLKKWVRGGTKVAGPSGEFTTHPLKREAIILEFGDVLHYFVRLARMLGISMEEIIDGNIGKLKARKAAKEKATRA
jgi:NTP pyrophosphatase (non-canonical NTP hydrolase)